MVVTGVWTSFPSVRDLIINMAQNPVPHCHRRYGQLVHLLRRGISGDEMNTRCDLAGCLLEIKLCTGLLQSFL